VCEQGMGIARHGGAQGRAHEGIRTCDSDLASMLRIGLNVCRMRLVTKFSCMGPRPGASFVDRLFIPNKLQTSALKML
jgi:hypothetical protein